MALTMTHKKNPHAVILGRLGGKAGTGAAKRRTPEQAAAAVEVRWARHRAKQNKAKGAK